jgi:hypothetical protein
MVCVDCVVLNTIIIYYYLLQYVVILGNIPQVGYLTDFDRWIFSMFIMLSLCVFCHQLVVNSNRKVVKWPFRAVIIRMVEMIGRIVVIPLSITLFTVTFNNDDIEEELKLMSLAFFVMFALILIRELFGVRKAIKKAMLMITKKVDLAELPCSWVELLALNMYVFRTINFTTAPYEAKKKRAKRMQSELGVHGSGAGAAVSSAEGGNININTRQGKEVQRSRHDSLLGRVFRRDSTYDSDDEL